LLFVQTPLHIKTVQAGYLAALFLVVRLRLGLRLDFLTKERWSSFLPDGIRLNGKKKSGCECAHKRWGMLVTSDHVSLISW